jgi:hypothetical protein
MIPKYIILHTAAHGNAQANHDTTAAQIDEWHRARDWRKIGYHYLVRLDGTVEPGRDEDEQGAHCRSMGMNRQSQGICFSGHADFHPWTPGQRDTGLDLVRRLMAKYDIPAENVLGHRETGANKSCPGRLVNMATVRSVLAGQAAASALSGEVEAGMVAAVAGPPAGVVADAQSEAVMVDATAMFRSICAIFDDPQFQQLPEATRAKVMDLRTAPPFADLTREDVM